MLALDNLSRLFRIARGLLALVGLAAVLLAALPAPRGALRQEFSWLARAVFVEEAAASPAPPAVAVPTALEPGSTREERALAEFISRRYRVADEASGAFVTSAFRAGSEFSVDPLLILAVMAIESRYNPVAESSMGAVGLMQVIPRYHPEKLLEHGGDEALLDPEINIRVGAQILREYLHRYGDTESALQKYAGALDEPNSQYAAKVLAEKARLQLVVARGRREA